MKKMTIVCLLLIGAVVFSFANDRSNLTKNSTSFGFVNACDSASNIQLMKDGGDHKAYQKLAPHEQTFLWTAVGLTIGFGVAITAGPVILGVNSFLFFYSGAINWYAYWGLNALGGLLVGSAVLLLCGAVAMWVLYAIVQHGKKEGYCMFKNVNTFECATAEGDGAAFGFKIAL